MVAKRGREVGGIAMGVEAEKPLAVVAQGHRSTTVGTSLVDGVRGNGDSALASSRRVEVIKGFFELTKPRIMVLLLFTGYSAMIVAAHGLPKLSTTLIAMIGLALSTGGSAAINMWYDRDVDQQMTRTRRRPIPAGVVKDSHALVFGIVLGVASVVFLAVFSNPLTAILSGIGYFYYAIIYTMWLKRTTPQNIVVGGGAGAFPPLIGWAAVTGILSWPAILMFLIIFLWTPPHFWALALYKNEDYTRANIPMMPVVRGARVTKIQSLLYAIALTVVSVLLYFTHVVGMIYLVVALALGIIFTAYNVRLLFEPATEFVWARKTFKVSLVYLMLVFVAMIINVKS